MTQSEAIDFSNDDVWALWAPLIEAVRPKGKTPPQDLRRTLSAIVWRHDNGAKWRSAPPHLGPWWRAAQLSIRWSKLGVWQRLLELCQQGGVSLGLADKGYAAHRFREAIWEMGSRPAIPTKSNEAPVGCPAWIYNNRHHIENAWARLKEWRAVAARYEKTAASFMGVLCLAAAVQWIKH